MFGLGFTEIMIIVVIAILFLGPDKLPSAMVDIAKFFRNVKNTIGTVKNSLEEEMNISDIKEEALAYKKELLSAGDDIKKSTGIADVGASLSNLGDDIMADEPEEIEKKPKEKKKPKATPKEEKVTFEKKSKIKDSEDV